jgi:outer membrane protein TolC
MDEFAKLTGEGDELVLALARVGYRRELLDAFKELRDNGGDINAVIQKLDISLTEAESERRKVRAAQEKRWASADAGTS